jgi:formate dehydrogenase
MAKILAVLYPDPVDGYPPRYVRDSIPTIAGYPDGQTLPTPSAIDFTPGELLGSVSGELGLRKFLEVAGHELVVTSDKDGPDSVFERELPTADVVISQPFWPAYLDAARIQKATNLKLAITAGIGSDHVDLDAAIRRGITVAEVTYSNSISVAEHAVMLVLDLVRNFVPAHEWVTTRRGWNIADSVSCAYDLEGMDVGVLAAGRIGVAVMKRLTPFDVHLHYTDKRRLPAEREQELGLTFYEDVASLVKNIDVLSIHAPLTNETYHLFDDALIGTMRRGSYIVNTARAEIMQRDAVVRALDSGRLAGYAGDVWYPQPPSEDHPWRTMPHNAMTPHVSGTSLPAQARYAAGTREILEAFLAGKPIRDEYLIVEGGALAGTGAKSYTVAPWSATRSATSSKLPIPARPPFADLGRTRPRRVRSRPTAASRRHRSLNRALPGSTARHGWGSFPVVGRFLGRIDYMKYVLLICDDETVSPSNEELEADPVHQAWAADLERRGGKLAGARLRPVVDATTVRVRDGETLVSDGPFAETKDFVGGLVIVECADLDEAIEIASGHPYARWGSVEVRPVWE